MPWTLFARWCLFRLGKLWVDDWSSVTGLLLRRNIIPVIQVLCLLKSTFSPFKKKKKKNERKIDEFECDRDERCDLMKSTTLPVDVK